MTTLERIKQQIAGNQILLYMKGTPDAPRCGFSAKAVQLVRACGVSFAHVDVLAEPEIRQELPHYAQWPTFPQLWVNGELIGGCDILTEMAENQELQPLLQAAVAPKAG